MSPDYAYDERASGSVGSAAEEAARLVEALRRWVDDRSSAGTPQSAETAECRLCPFCQLLSVVRQGQPEVFEHLGHAADSLLAAVRAGISAHETHWAGPSRPDVEHIDID